MSGVSDNAACPPPPIADDPSALLSPTSSPSSRLLQSVTLLAWSLDASLHMPVVVLNFSRYCTIRLKLFYLGTSLVVQRLTFWASAAGGMSLIPGWETKIPHEVWCNQLYIYIFFYLLCLFFMYYLCEKYYKPIMVQYYIADCVSLSTSADPGCSKERWRRRGSGNNN